MRERIRWDLIHALIIIYGLRHFRINDWMTFVFLEITKLADPLWPWMKSDGRVRRSSWRTPDIKKREAGNESQNWTGSSS